MRVVVRWMSWSGLKQRVMISANRRVTFGGGEFADQQILGTSRLPDVCFMLETDSAECRLVVAANHREVVAVNGQGVGHSVALADGDRISVGGAELAVEIEATSASDDSENAPPQSATFTSSETPSRLARLQNDDDQSPVGQVVAQVSEKVPAILLGNFRFGGVSLPEWVEEADDLYEPYPDEVREIYSLHAMADRELDELIAVGRELADRDASVWCFSQKPWDELKEDLKFYLAWFARPSVLKMQFDEGGKELAHGIMNCLDVLLLDLGNDDWVLYRNPTDNKPWDELGFDGAIIESGS